MLGRRSLGSRDEDGRPGLGSSLGGFTRHDAFANREATANVRPHVIMALRRCASWRSSRTTLHATLPYLLSDCLLEALFATDLRACARNFRRDARPLRHRASKAQIGHRHHGEALLEDSPAGSQGFSSWTPYDIFDLRLVSRPDSWPALADSRLADQFARHPAMLSSILSSDQKRP